MYVILDMELYDINLYKLLLPLHFADILLGAKFDFSSFMFARLFTNFVMSRGFHLAGLFEI